MCVYLPSTYRCLTTNSGLFFAYINAECIDSSKFMAKHCRKKYQYGITTSRMYTSTLYTRTTFMSQGQNLCGCRSRGHVLHVRRSCRSPQSLKNVWDFLALRMLIERNLRDARDLDRVWPMGSVWSRSFTHVWVGWGGMISWSAHICRVGSQRCARSRSHLPDGI